MEQQLEQFNNQPMKKNRKLLKGLILFIVIYITFFIITAIIFWPPMIFPGITIYSISQCPGGCPLLCKGKEIKLKCDGNAWSLGDNVNTRHGNIQLEWCNPKISCNYLCLGIVDNPCRGDRLKNLD